MRPRDLPLLLSLLLLAPVGARATTPDRSATIAALLAADPVMLRYAGAPFERFSTFGSPPETFDGSDSLIATITLAAPLPVNFRGDVVPLSFAFAAGGKHVTDATATRTEFYFETDTAGAIVVWYVEAVSESPERLLTQLATVQLLPYENDVGSFATVRRCGSDNPFACDTVYFAQGLSDAPGIWTTGSDGAADVAAPPTVSLLVAGVAALAATRRRARPVDGSDRSLS